MVELSEEVTRTEVEEDRKRTKEEFDKSADEFDKDERGSVILSEAGDESRANVLQEDRSAIDEAFASGNKAIYDKVDRDIRVQAEVIEGRANPLEDRARLRSEDSYTDAGMLIGKARASEIAGLTTSLEQAGEAAKSAGDFNREIADQQGRDTAEAKAKEEQTVMSIHARRPSFGRH